MILVDLPIAEYHARPELSSSGLNLFARSPAHFRAGWRNIGDDTARLGHALHDAVLEGGGQLVDVPDWPKASDEDRERWARWFTGNGATIDTTRKGPGAATWFGALEAQTGKYALSPDERKMIDGMAASLRAHPELGPLFADPRGVAERSIIGEINGVAVRCRPDWWIPSRSIVVDVKTALDAREHKFRMVAADRRMHVAEWLYSTLVHAETGEWPDFLFAVVEKSEPYVAACYRLGPDAAANARYLGERDLALYRRCMETGRWPGYPTNDCLGIPIYDPEPAPDLDWS